MILLRSTFPRYRYDQLMLLCWTSIFPSEWLYFLFVFFSLAVPQPITQLFFIIARQQPCANSINFINEIELNGATGAALKVNKSKLTQQANEADATINLFQQCCNKLNGWLVASWLALYLLVWFHNAASGWYKQL